MTWHRMPLFVWSLYATAWVQVLATPIIGITLLLVIAGARLRHRRLRPGQGRRSAPLPAPLLDLLAPGRLHHDPAGHGRHHRDHPHLRAPDDLRLQGDRLLLDRHRRARIARLGAPHVHERHERRGQHRSSRSSPSSWPSRARSRSSTGPRPSTRGRSSCAPPMLFALTFIFLFSHRRADRAHAGRARRQRAPARHLLHRRALPLRDVRRHRASGFFAALLYWFPKMFGKMYNEKVAAIAWFPIFVGFNMLYFTHAGPGLHGHAAALLHPPAPVPHGPRHRLDRLASSWRPAWSCFFAQPRRRALQREEGRGRTRGEA